MSSTGRGSRAPSRIARTRPTCSVTYSARSPVRVVNAVGSSTRATGVSLTRTSPPDEDFVFEVDEPPLSLHPATRSAGAARIGIPGAKDRGARREVVIVAGTLSRRALKVGAPSLSAETAALPTGSAEPEPGTAPKEDCEVRRARAGRVRGRA